MATTLGPLIIAIQDGTFPDSEELLSASINSKNIPTLLQDIAQARTALQDEIKEISRSEAEDVDSWIAQAKKVQDDIEKCKAEARHIVEEHERLEAIRQERNEARSRTHLLREEIVYNETLEQQIQQIGHVSTVLGDIESLIHNGQLDRAAEALQPIRGTIETIRGGEVRRLLETAHEGLERTTKQSLLDLAHRAIEIRKEKDSVSVMITKSVAMAQSVEGASAHETAAPLHLEQVLSSLQLMNAFEELVADTVLKISSVLRPHLHAKSTSRISEAHDSDGRLVLGLTTQYVNAAQQVDAIRVLTSYLQQHLPASIRKSVLSRTLEVMIPKMIMNILDPATPVSVENLSQVRAIEAKVQNLVNVLKACEVPQHEGLSLWCSQISQKWVTKKRVSSLDQVRQMLRKESPTTLQVERVERQVVGPELTLSVTTASKKEEEEEDWSAWDVDDDDDSNIGKGQTARSTASQAKADDGSDTWGFDDDEDTSQNHGRSETKDAAADSTGTTSKVDVGVADAWGWDDEDTSPVADKATSSAMLKSNGLPLRSKTNPAVATTRGDAAEAQDQVAELRELYTVTSIPEAILQVLQEYSSAIQEVMSSPSTYFPHPTPESSIDFQNSLAEGPSQIMALYRALAPSQYPSSILRLTQMHLYNDTLYLVSRLSEPDVKMASTDLQKLTTFATQTYTIEIAQQRQILLDLLDTAQSFISCTREPYASSCETAIASTTDYLRSLHAQWQPILGQSHLYQALGSLLSSVISKIILDILDMEDISEPESKKLNDFCERIAGLSVLFASMPTSTSTSTRDKTVATDHDNELDPSTAPSSIALFVPNYLRFQYLMQVLTGNLKDIEYLWTEAGLSLEFSRDEVIDLIKALFSDSARRRDVIGRIRR